MSSRSRDGEKAIYLNYRDTGDGRSSLRNFALALSAVLAWLPHGAFFLQH